MRSKSRARTQGLPHGWQRHARHRSKAPETRMNVLNSTRVAISKLAQEPNAPLIAGRRIRVCLNGWDQGHLRSVGAQSHLNVFKRVGASLLNG